MYRKSQKEKRAIIGWKHNIVIAIYGMVAWLKRCNTGVVGGGWEDSCRAVVEH